MEGVQCRFCRRLGIDKGAKTLNPAPPKICGGRVQIFLHVRSVYVNKYIMKHIPFPSSLPATAPELVRRFGAILMGLAAVVARRFLREPRLMTLTVPLWGWLSRSVQRFGRAVVRTIPTRTGSRGGQVRSARAAGVRLPAGRGWLVGVLGYEAVAYGSQLEHLLAEPEMQALVAALPGLGRILRPLRRMLGVADVVAAVTVVAPRQKRARRVVVWPRKGLPQVPKGGWFEPPVQNRG